MVCNTNQLRLFVFVVSGLYSLAWTSQDPNWGKKIDEQQNDEKEMSIDKKQVTWQRLKPVVPAWKLTQVQPCENDVLLRVEVLRRRFLKQLNNNGKTALHEAIDQLADQETLDEALLKINELIYHQPDLIDSCDAESRKPLVMLISGYGTKEWVSDIVASMLKKRPYLVNSSDDKKNSLLYLAVEAQNQRLCRVLLEHKALVNQENSVRSAIPLHVACALGNWPIFEMLIDAGSDVNKTDFFGATPLHYVVGKPWFRKSISEQEAFYKPPSSYGNEWFKHYLNQCNIRCAMLAKLVVAGADLEARDCQWLSAMGYAKFYKHASLVYLLDSLINDQTFRSALVWACKTSNNYKMFMEDKLKLDLQSFNSPHTTFPHLFTKNILSCNNLDLTLHFSKLSNDYRHEKDELWHRQLQRSIKLLPSVNVAGLCTRPQKSMAG